MAPDFTNKLLLNDVAILDDAGCEDKTLAALAADHAARVKTLLQAIQCPSFSRALALSLSQKLLDVANDIDANSYQEPELVNVGA